MIIITFICAAIILFNLYVLIKNENTYRQHMKISDAIFDYQWDMLDKYAFTSAEIISVTDIEHYNKTLFRLWDWGCTRILPKEEYEIIKPYIKKEVK